MALDLDAFNDMADVDSSPEENIIERLRFDEALDIPHQITDVDLWLNYCNDDLYHLDIAVRAFIKKSRWSRLTKGNMKTAVPLVFMNIFGRKATAHDQWVCRYLHRLLEYYCTSYTGRTKINGVRFNRVYYFSKYSCQRKRPLSLRLRLEESDAAASSFREYNPGKDKRAQSRPGVTAHGPFADGRGCVSK